MLKGPGSKIYKLINVYVRYPFRILLDVVYFKVYLLIKTWINLVGDAINSYRDIDIH